VSEVVVAPKGAPKGAGPAEKLLSLYAYGSDEAYAGADKLTFGIAEETAKWPPDGGRETVRKWWLGKIKKHCGEEEAEAWKRVWVEAWAKPKPEEPEPAAEPVLPKARERLKGGVRSWDEVVVPPGAGELEALTYVPGLVGDIVEWVLKGAHRPNRMMALGVALAVVGTLTGRFVVGPTGSATHLYIIILAMSGCGKDYPLRAGKTLMEAMAAGDLIGPDEFVSTQGIWRRLRRTPLLICFVDEMGDELAKINGQGNNAWVSAITGLLKKTYNAWEIAHTPEGAHSDESERLPWVAVSLVGAATPEAFFEGLKPGDLESGFVNRMLILPFEGHQRPPQQIPPHGADVPPPELVEALKGLPRQKQHAQVVDLDQPWKDGKPVLKLPERLPPMPWGPGAEEAYFAYSKKVDQFAEVDKQRFSLSQRGCENAARLATNVAQGRGSPTVDREDIEWAIKFAERSIKAGIGGVDEFMEEYYAFPKFCTKVIEKLRACGGWRSKRDLKRDFRNNMKTRFDLGNVIEQLKEEGRVKDEVRAGGGRGPAIEGYALVEVGPTRKAEPKTKALS
jgi:hypothetical protein